MHHDRGAYRHRSLRLAGFDYSTPTAYFVTICTFARAPLFEDASVREAVRWSWEAATGHKPVPNYDFVVMPNHVHGIVWVQKKAYVVAEGDAGAQRYAVASSCRTRVDRDVQPHAGQEGAAPLRGRHPMVLPGSLGEMVRTFKERCARRLVGYHGFTMPIWRRNYYEHIIRNDLDLREKREYILHNPARWDEVHSPPSRAG